MPDVTAGQGRGSLPDNIQLRLGVLRGMSQFFIRQMDADDGVRCPRHKVEHTGKNVYAALLHLANWRFTREDEYLDVAKRVVLRTVDNLGLDAGSGVQVFLPGRTDGRNSSNNAIDGGACVDTICTLLDEVPDIFTDDERHRCDVAVTTHVEEYLRHAARERPIPAQRLWAGTGVARAAVRYGRDDWRADVLAGCALSVSEISPDGLAPYIPEGAPDCEHPGLADLSTYYHSRTPGFLLAIHDVLDEPLDEATRQAVDRALDVLVAMRDGNGRKVLHNEAKAWYWESEYEVASHPFDAYALQLGAEHLGRPELKAEAAHAVEEWIAHISALDGGAQSHHGPGKNYQCPIFWSAHAAWVARIIERVGVHAVRREPRDVDLRASGVVHVERERYTAILRGAHRGSSHLFGCDVGGGALQSLVVRPDPRMPYGEEIVAPRKRFERRRPGTFLFKPAGGGARLSRLRALYASQRSQFRFRAWSAMFEWKSGRPFAACSIGWRFLVKRAWQTASPWRAAHLDVATTHTYADGTLVFEGGVADHDGTRVAGVTTRRRYVLAEDGIDLEDVLLFDASAPAGSLEYIAPAGLVDIAVSCDGGTVSTRGDVTSVRWPGGHAGRLEIKGRWSC